MPGRDAILRGGTAAAAAVALTLAATVAGCGGGERQDANDADGTYKVAVDASFPARQALADESELRLVVANRSGKRIPNLAATVEMAGDGDQAQAFSRLDESTGLASRSRPVWIVDQGPGMTAYSDTWAYGPLEPGKTATLSWQVSAISAGRYRIRWRLAGSLGGRAKVVQSDDQQAQGTFDVTIGRAPAQARVDADGQVVRVPAGGDEAAAGR
ncbi:hypothetical protein Q5424_08455 [Conexibacter sp. JD483]|uniref:hypothetical protein n=1 Tax=unclassified Conexibacter TaxID=2627773 RepID=UPI00271B03FC|nr:MULTISPECIES: hypothetical protein [unclassified Conexibacter]MDO8186148.1 hypothetical protein [Conexibacter sp. CPCC 205706]MDO8199638.1 hypothetical protein [Conexibacter sp. CPCC 205762]MDR9369108.1 hypothetical protein [Conexibacter sp. JD483]